MAALESDNIATASGDGSKLYTILSACKIPDSSAEKTLEFFVSSQD
jgi:hypothetical protein